MLAVSTEIIFAVIALLALVYYASYRSKNRDLVFLRRGEMLAGRAEHEDALEAFKIALEANPDLTEAKLGMVDSYRRLDRLDEAIEACQEVLSKSEGGDDSRITDTLSLLGWLCIEAGRGEEAAAALGRVVAVWPENVEAQKALAEAYRLFGRYRDALAVYEQLVEEHGDVQLLYRMGDLYRHVGDCQEAAGVYREALAMQAQSGHSQAGCSQTLMILGDTFAEFEQYEDALLAYDEAHQPDPQWGAPYCGMGDVLLKLGKGDEAMASFRKALEVDDAWEDAWRGVGDVHAQAGRADEAMEAYRKALEINPNFAAAHLDMGKLLLAGGDGAAARDAFAAAAEFDPRGEVGTEARAAIEQLTTPDSPPAE